MAANPAGPAAMDADLMKVLDDVSELVGVYRGGLSGYIRRTEVCGYKYDLLLGKDDLGNRMKTYLELKHVKTNARTCERMTAAKLAELLANAKAGPPGVFIIKDLEAASPALVAELQTQINLLRAEKSLCVLMACTVSFVAVDATLRQNFSQITLQESTPGQP